MPNRITNATGLDGVTGWTSAGGAVSVDGAVIGAPNRLVIVGSGASLSAEGEVVAGETLEIGVDHRQGHAVTVQFFAGGGNVGAAQAVAVVRQGRQTPARGIASTFSRSAGRLETPVGATGARLIVTGAAPVAFRPLVGSIGECWRPGEHLNPDLDIRSWPASIEIQQSGFELEPIPLRKSFAGDAGIPINRRVSNVSRRFCRFEMKLDGIERDVLDQFWRDNVDEFWFVRPDNGDLCRAEWADDGDPRDSGSGSQRRTSARLLLRDS